MVRINASRTGVLLISLFCQPVNAQLSARLEILIDDCRDEGVIGDVCKGLMLTASERSVVLPGMLIGHDTVFLRA
ncbi:MAG: hypothetical protein IPK19_14570 [Chloroflexi bacterium]|nr:hypothetical protein [Chloroflexota bacterium]